MLKTIDILLGVSVVMLVVSMAVTVLTQFVLGILQSRGRNLMLGLANLLQQIDPELPREVVEKIATAVLSHPMTAAAGKFKRLGITIHREEFTKLLMDLAAGHAPADILSILDGGAREKLQELLRKNDIEDPAKVLDNVRAMALHLEMANPAWAAHERQAQALMREAQGKLVAKVNAWFDVTIDRVSERFTRSTHNLTAACAIVVAFTLQLDTIGLINRLSTDDAFRQQMVNKAIEMSNQPPPASATMGAGAQSAGPNSGAGSGQTPVTAAPSDGAVSPVAMKLTDAQRAEIDKLAEAGILDIPDGYSAWQARWADVRLFGKWQILGDGALGAQPQHQPAEVKQRQQANFLGVLLSALLLSLGAPFWYNALKNLLQLRSLVSRKDDQQRGTRQQAQAPTAGVADSGATVSAAVALTGEKGIIH